MKDEDRTALRDFLISLAAAVVIAALLIGLVFGCEYYNTH